MQKFKTKTVFVEAVQFTIGMLKGKEPAPECLRIDPFFPYVKTFNGYRNIFIGDWIVTNENGEHSICSESVFNSDYEKADEKIQN